MRSFSSVHFHALLAVLPTLVYSVAPPSSATKACSSLVNLLGNAKVQSSGAQYNASAKGAYDVFNQLDGAIIFCIV